MTDNLILYLIFQPNVCSEEYSFTFKCLDEFAKERGPKELFTLLGDLLDRNLYGRESCSCFEQRLEYYLRAENISRIISILILVHQKIHDADLKQKLELAIIEYMKKKQTYSISDFRTLLRYSGMGITHPLSPAFLHFNFPEVVAQGSKSSQR